jgi:hypothetical protein
VSAGRIPYLTGFTQLAPTDNPNVALYQQVLQRVYIDQVSGTLQYPLSVTRRFEVNPGISRYSYSSEVQEVPITANGQVVGQVTRRSANEFNFDPVNVGQVGVAFVGDNSFGGFVSPIAGQRFRFEVTPTVGTLNYQTALADYRRYFFARPVTLAFRGTHFGRYGKDENDPLLFPLYLGQGQLVRGYQYNSVINECARTTTTTGECPALRRLFGNRVAITSAELRIPLLGTEQLGLIRSPFLPLEVAPFVDAGVAWSKGDEPLLRFDRNTEGRVPVVSTGVAMRTNLLGFAIVEVYYAYPFQRPGEGAHWGLNLAPGW